MFPLFQLLWLVKFLISLRGARLWAVVMSLLLAVSATLAILAIISLLSRLPHRIVI
jgi:hypothetical protein